MPFCRECGKQVEESWINCPHCSQRIVASNSTKLEVRDSVIIGDITLDETKNCNNCGALGALQLPCIECKILCSCEVCNRDYLISNYDKHSVDFEGSCLEIWSDDYSLIMEEIGSIRYDFIENSDVRCETCYLKFANLRCNKHCNNCNKKFQFPDEYFRFTKGDRGIDQDGGEFDVPPEWVFLDELCRSCGRLTFKKNQSIEKVQFFRNSLDSIKEKIAKYQEVFPGHKANPDERKRMKIWTESIPKLELEIIEIEHKLSELKNKSKGSSDYP